MKTLQFEDEEAASYYEKQASNFLWKRNKRLINMELTYKQVLDDMKQTLDVTGKKLFMPFRVALTGKCMGLNWRRLRNC